MVLRNHAHDYTTSCPQLLLMKKGGQVIYGGPLGRNSHKLIEYFEVNPLPV